jgi:hypothetical protein
MIYKKLVIVLLISLFVFSVRAQVSERRGYIGLGLGPSFLAGYELGDEKAATGLNIALANFGYVFSKGFGISGVWTGGAHKFNSKIELTIGNNAAVTGQFEGTVSYGALMVGPLYSIKLSDNSCVDFKARAGLFYAKESMTSGLFSSELDNSSIGYSFAISYQMKIAKRWCIMLSGDYFSGELESISSSNKHLNAVAVNAGVGFLL